MNTDSQKRIEDLATLMGVTAKDVENLATWIVDTMVNDGVTAEHLEADKSPLITAYLYHVIDQGQKMRMEYMTNPQTRARLISALYAEIKNQ